MGATAIVPVKPWRLAKSRLHVPGIPTVALSRAFALDVLAVLHATPGIDRVVVVSAEAELAAAARRGGAALVVDRPMLARDPLNDAIREGRRWAAVHATDRPVVVVPSDLPALSVDSLEAALGRLGDHDLAFVPDAQGSGTTLAWARQPRLLSPGYGGGSALRHLSTGAAVVHDVDPCVRRDVDTVDDLSVARWLGVGPATRDVLAACSTPVRRAVRRPGVGAPR